MMQQSHLSRSLHFGQMARVRPTERLLIIVFHMRDIFSCMTVQMEAIK